MNRRDFLRKVALAGAAVPLLGLDVAKAATGIVARDEQHVPSQSSPLFPWVGDECIPKGDPGARIRIAPTTKTWDKYNEFGCPTGEKVQGTWAFWTEFGDERFEDAERQPLVHYAATDRIIAQRSAQGFYLRYRRAHFELGYDLVGKYERTFTGPIGITGMAARADDRRMSIGFDKVIVSTPEGPTICESVVDGLWTLLDIPKQGVVTIQRWGMNMPFASMEAAARCMAL